MQHELTNQIIEKLEACPDTDLLDFILKLLLESGH